MFWEFNKSGSHLLSEQWSFPTLVVFRLHYIYFEEFCNCFLNASIYSTLEHITFVTIVTDNEKFKCQLKKCMRGYPGLFSLFYKLQQ